MVSSTLQVERPGGHSQSNVGRPSRPFLGKSWEPQLSAGKDGTTNPDKECWYCKDTGHKLNNCKCLQYKEDLLAAKKSGEGSN